MAPESNIVDILTYMYRFPEMFVVEAVEGEGSKVVSHPIQSNSIKFGGLTIASWKYIHCLSFKIFFSFPIVTGNHLEINLPENNHEIHRFLK